MIITQDAEVNDQNSLKHFLFYTNEVELQALFRPPVNSTGMAAMACR